MVKTLDFIKRKAKFLQSLLRYLAENNYQIIGNLTENLLSEEESRLKLPVRELFDELPEPANDWFCAAKKVVLILKPKKHVGFSQQLGNFIRI